MRNNYRSTQAIFDAAQGVSSRETTLTARAGHFRASERDAGAPRGPFFACHGVLFHRAKDKGLIATGMPAEEIVVLYRNNKDVVPLAEMLEKQNVPLP